MLTWAWSVSKLLNAKVIFIPLEEFNEFAFLADISRWDPVKIYRTEHSAMQRNARFEHEALRNGKNDKKHLHEPRDQTSSRSFERGKHYSL